MTLKYPPRVQRMIEVIERGLRVVNTYGRTDARLPEDVIQERARNIVSVLLADSNEELPPDVNGG